MEDDAMEDDTMAESTEDSMDGEEMAEPEALSPTVSRLTPPKGDPIQGGQYRAPGLDGRALTRTLLPVPPIRHP